MTIISSSEDYVLKNKQNVLDINIVNNGNTKLKYVKIEIDKENLDSNVILLSSDVVYVGNIDSDDYESASFNVYVGNIDEIELPLKISYMDELNRNYEYTYKAHFVVYDNEDLTKLGLVEKSKYPYYLVFVILFVLGYVFYRYRKKHRHKHHE